MKEWALQRRPSRRRNAFMGLYMANLDDFEDFTKETEDEEEIRIASAHEHDSDWIP